MDGYPVGTSVWERCYRLDDDAQHVAKFVFSRGDAVAEAVLYRYPDYRTRTVVCCSVMSGCPVGCQFCGSGGHFICNLSAWEIIAQVETCMEAIDCLPEDIARLQIMFMAMGEPLLNLQEVIPALWSLHSRYPKAELLVSTSAPMVDVRRLFHMAKYIPAIGLQYSVHETTDAARNRLIPFKAKLRLSEIATQGVSFSRHTGRRPFFNYCAHEGNVSVADADRLRRLFHPDTWRATVSIICERNEGMPVNTPEQRQLATHFAGLLAERGFDVHVFDPAGQDTIGAGCGQLWYFQRQWEERSKGKRESTG